MYELSRSRVNCEEQHFYHCFFCKKNMRENDVMIEADMEWFADKNKVRRFHEECFQKVKEAELCR